MKQKVIALFNAYIQGLSAEKKNQFLQELNEAVHGNQSIKVATCPCCEKTEFMKYGFYKGVQKYKCLISKESFTYKTKTPISGIYKLNGINQLMELMMTIGYMTLDEIQKAMPISRPTALNWRNKILTALFQIPSINGIIEFDETNFMISNKGRHGLTFAEKEEVNL